MTNEAAKVRLVEDKKAPLLSSNWRLFVVKNGVMEWTGRRPEKAENGKFSNKHKAKKKHGHKDFIGNGLRKKKTKKRNKKNFLISFALLVSTFQLYFMGYIFLLGL